MKNETQEKEVALAKTQSSKALIAANNLVVTNEEEYAFAGELRAKIKQAGKVIKDSKESVYRPFKMALDNLVAKFKPIETEHAAAEKIVNEKMLSYYREQQKKAEAEKLKIAQKVESGYIRPDTAIKKMENIEEAPKSVVSASGTTFVRKVPSMRIVNEAIIPDEFWVIDMVKLRRAVVIEKKEVPGAEYFEDETMGGR